jgi:PKD repeat protein
MIQHTSLPIFILLFILAGCEKPAPVASFTPSTDLAQVGDLITFTNTSQNADTYRWNFGDGSNSSEVSPSHSYDDAGTYTVELTATGEGGLSIATATLTIAHPEPVAAFTMDRHSALTLQAVHFFNNSENATSYVWQFGDGTSSTEQSPIHSYSVAGTFTITLTANGPGGSASASDQISVTEAGYNIFPGYRIGDFVLGNDLEEHFAYIVDEEFGWGYMDMGDGYYLHLMEFDTTGIGFILLKDNLDLSYSDVPVAIYAFEPFVGHTEPGITFGSTFAEVEAAYGTPDAVLDDGTYDYVGSLGIAFMADSTASFVEYIYIEEPYYTKSSRPDWLWMQKRLRSAARRSLSVILRKEE